MGYDKNKTKQSSTLLTPSVPQVLLLLLFIIIIIIAWKASEEPIPFPADWATSAHQ